MRNKLVVEKQAELGALSKQEFIDRMLSFPVSFYADHDRRYDRKLAEASRKRDYRISDRQHANLIDTFAELMIVDTKVKGITFHENDPAFFQKSILPSDSNTKTKKTYAMDFLLEPEPGNIHDRNAVKVSATYRDGTLSQIGFLPAAFVKENPITSPVWAKGTLTDYSNGTFNNVSYSIPLDLERIHHIGQAAYTTPVYLNDVLIDTQEMPQKDGCVYEMPFALQGTANDTAKAEAYLKDINMGADLAEDMRACGCPAEIDEIAYRFSGPSKGVVSVISKEPLTDGQLSVADAFLHHQHTDGYVASHLKQQSFMDIPLTSDTFTPEYGHFAASSMPPSLDEHGRYAPPEGVEVDDTNIERLSMTNDDLSFGEQLNLSDFGLH